MHNFLTIFRTEKFTVGTSWLQFSPREQGGGPGSSSYGAVLPDAEDADGHRGLDAGASTGRKPPAAPEDAGAKCLSDPGCQAYDWLGWDTSVPGQVNAARNHLLLHGLLPGVFCRRCRDAFSQTAPLPAARVALRGRQACLPRGPGPGRRCVRGHFHG
jgi:hypothetical protein